jgi:hypothetical protein
MTWKQQLKALRPCPEAYKWACQFTTYRQAWRACEDGYWMRWLVRQCEGKESDMYQAMGVVVEWGWLTNRPFGFDALCDAYCVLDFMPDPPELP